MIRIVAATAVFLLAIAATALPFVGSDFAYIPGDLVDTRLNNFILEHGYRCLRGQQADFWHLPICYPARWVTTGSDAHLGNLPIYAAFRGCGAGPERAFQFWWIATLALTFSATCVAMRSLGIGWVGGIVAAVAFTFSPAQMVCAPHVQLFPRYFVPLTVVCYWRFLHTGNWRPLLGSVACGVGQVYSSVYLAYFLALFLLALTLSASAVVSLKQLFRVGGREWIVRGAIVLGGTAALLPLLLPYLAPDRDAWKPPPEEIVAFLPKPADWLRASPTSATWNWTATLTGVEYTSAGPPFQLFPGGFALVGLIVGIGCIVARIVSRSANGNLRVRVVTAFTLAAMAVGVVVLHVGDFCPYRLLMQLPFVDGLRATFRVGLVLVFPLAVVAGIAIDQVLSWLRGHAVQKFAIGVILALAINDVRSTDAKSRRSGISRTSIAECIARRESLTEKVRPLRTPNSILYVFPESDELIPTLIVQLDAMWAAQSLDMPTVNGWTGHLPSGWTPFRTRATLLRWLESHRGVEQHRMNDLIFFGTSTDVKEVVRDDAVPTHVVVHPSSRTR